MVQRLDYQQVIEMFLNQNDNVHHVLVNQEENVHNYFVIVDSNISIKNKS